MKWTIYDTIIYLKIEKSLPILAASLCVRSDSCVSSTSHLWRTLYRVHLNVVEVCIWYTSPLANFASSTPQRFRSLYRAHLTHGELCIEYTSTLQKFVSDTPHPWRTLYRVHLNVVEVCIGHTSPLAGIDLNTLLAIGTDCIHCTQIQLQLQYDHDSGDLHYFCSY